MHETPLPLFQTTGNLQFYNGKPPDLQRETFRSTMDLWHWGRAGMFSHAENTELPKFSYQHIQPELLKAPEMCQYRTWGMRAL